MWKYIKNNPLSGLKLQISDKFKNLDPKAVANSLGVGGQDLFESSPEYNQAPCEKVIKGKSDSYIVLGRDRYGNLLQGRGMLGEAKASSIDIVVGRWSGAVPETTTTGEYRYVDPNFQRDAARIYISQKTDVDANFKITPGKVGTYSNRSAIALKADGIRLLAREGIKLVTNIDPFNSKGTEPSEAGIDLIALNKDKDLQPIPKGDNLASALERVTKHVSDLNKVVTCFLLYQMKMNLAVSNHVHVSPFGGSNTSPSLRLEKEGPSIAKDLQRRVDKSLKTHREELEEFKLTFLTKGQKRYINSKYNNTN